jgi:PAS domain S-box-containing protein
MFGFSKDELLNMSIEDVARQCDQEGYTIIRSAYEQFYNGSSLPPKAEIKIYRKDGKNIWIEASVGRIEYDGKPAMLVNVFEITERKVAQEELSRVRDELEIRVHERTSELKASNEALREEILERRQAEIALTETKMQAELYVDLMGHDINNLNQIAAGYLELAIDTLEIPADKSELLEKPLEALKNSSRLIENVRKLQRIKTGKSHLEDIDLDKVMKEVHAQYSGIVDGRIAINSNLSRGARVMANELLSDVFSNLIGNAIKHSHRQPVIGISLAEDWAGDCKCYRVAVEDNGQGVPDEYKQIIFNRQQRGQTKAPGSGIGLHLVKTLVDEYGGQVWVEDRIPGDISQGSRFVVVLPAADQ